MGEKQDEVKVTLEDIRKMPDVENSDFLDLGEVGIDIKPVSIKIGEEKYRKEC